MKFLIKTLNTILFKLICSHFIVIPIFLVSFLMIILSSNLAIGQSNTEIEEMRNYTHDMGSWMGARAGVQTNGGSISERWAWSVVYEYRYSQLFSVPVELQFFNHRVIWWNGKENVKLFEIEPALSAALKMRVLIYEMNLFIQGGLQSIIGSGFALRMPYYGVGFEIFLWEKISFYANLQKNIIPDYEYFVLIGTNVQITSLTK